jgi:hypothetical protein
MTYEAPTQIKATLLHDYVTDGWANLYRCLTEEELRNTTMYAHATFNRVANDWAENSPIQVSVLAKDIYISVAPLEDDGDNVLEFKVPLADVIMTSPAWDPADAAPLAALLRQLADQLEKTDNQTEGDVA